MPMAGIRPTRGWSLVVRMLQVTVLVVLISFSLEIFGAETPTIPNDLKNSKTVTLLFTNDLESTYDPVLAYWRDDMEHIGGIAQLATLIDRLSRLGRKCLPVRCRRHIHRGPRQADPR